MRRTIRSLFVTAPLAAVLLAAGSAQAITTPVVSTRLDESCNLGFTFSQPTVLSPLVLGDAWADCKVPPVRHVMELSLERRDTSGKWITMATSTDRRIPAPRVNYHVSAECSPGLWMITAHATGSLQSNPFDFTDHSRQRAVSASECPRG